MHRKIGLLVAVGLILAAPFQTANGQGQGLGQTFHKGVVYTELYQPVPLPLIPEYSGVKPKYTYGKKGQNQKTGFVGYEFEYQIKESPRQVLDWYREVLKQGRWTLSKAQDKGTEISAERQKEGYSVIVSVFPPKVPGYNTSLHIGFSTYKPFDAEEEDAKKAKNAPFRPQSQQQPQR